ncbi:MULTISPECIES: hypothetical protein [Chitinibacter]|uniref:hypothetical protein n=1 Tax=Chitinibacter TaxID=230666 RepID=UPI000427CEB6|nr:MULTISPECIES: hypothetical protein [Chitinibacter]
MADWSIWKTLEEWRSKRHELDPVFARAGVAPELETLANRIAIDLRRSPPTKPLLSGETDRDDKAMSMYFEAYYQHFDEPLYKVESLVRMPWVPEAEASGRAILAEVERIRKEMRTHPGTHPPFEPLDQLIQHYLRLDDPDLNLPTDVLAQRRNQLIDIAGYPLLVQHTIKTPYDDSIPPLSSPAFRDQLHEKMQQYLDQPWLHCRVITQWYLSLALDAALAHKKHDATDDARIRSMLKRRWPTASVLFPELEHIDQVWYLLLALGAIVTLLMELWWFAVPLLLWLNLSVGGHRREHKEMETRRAQLVSRAQSLKKARDRFSHQQLPLERLAPILRQLDEQGEYFDDRVFALIALHQYTG